MNTQLIQQFYDNINFPGTYNRADLELFFPYIKNPYLYHIDRHLRDNLHVLDIGCGTGLISHVFALKYPNCKITALDFASASIEFAQKFKKQNGINNVEFKNLDLFHYTSDQQFDAIICQGVLHHMPDTQRALTKIDQMLAPGGLIMLGVYHPLGKILKRFYNINYMNKILYLDQEQNPFELSFTKAAVKKWFKHPKYEQIDQYPKSILRYSVQNFMLFSRNGGLVLYIFQKIL